MKKLFPILALSMVIGLFSSCIINVNSSKHSITFYNDLPDSINNDIFDWYAKNNAGTTYSVSSYATPIRSGGRSSTIDDLREDYYVVIYTFDDTTDSYDGDTYYETDKFYLDRDIELYLSESSRKHVVTVRSAAGIVEEKTETEKVLQIVDSDGNVYPLKKVEK